MRPSFQPRLVNDPFSDPGLLIPFLFEKRALMFDLGDLSTLSSKDLLKISHVFVTHTHMDHFIGFDTLLRIFLGREKTLYLFGPPNFFKHVEGKLAGYTWNLVNEFQNNFVLEVSEVHPDKILTKTYVCRDSFHPQDPPTSRPHTGILLKEPSFSVHSVLLDHRTPCLAFSLIENFYVNIDKDALEKLRLPVGPWLNRLKSAIYEKKDPQEDFYVTWEEKGTGLQEKTFNLGDLVKKVTRISPGQKIVYITDVSAGPENSRKMIEFAKGADFLFIEAAFLESEKEVASRKYHLTAREAGEVAKKAGVRHFRLFHFSPRYNKRAQEMQEEAIRAYKKSN
jgi:ribonuclease Z